MIRSAVLPKDYPIADRAEVAVVGRSNAGKSSFINQVLGKKIARVSASPGKTILLNFYDAGKFYRLEDMPGYGFAKRSREEVQKWKEMIETYLMNRDCLSGLVLLVDCQRRWQAEEEDLKRWCESAGIPMLLALTKSDKLKQSEKSKKQDYFLKASGLPCFLISNTKKQGIQDVEAYIFEEWVKE